MNTTFSRKEVWIAPVGPLTVEVVHFGMDNPNLNNGKGIWNYYVYIHEKNIPDFERKLWLEDKTFKFNETGREYIAHDYYNSLPPEIHRADWHGEITYYAKHGHTIGHRSVEIGCDFNHLFDHDNGLYYRFEDVASEAVNTAQKLIEILNAK